MFPPAVVTFPSLLAELADPATLAEFPRSDYRCLHASSYNRESVKRGQPGWFADSDGTGFIRQETVAGKPEWVMLEHTGPGCLTKLWTPFFYYDFNDRTGPNIRIYLDGSPTPVIDESYIRLVTGQGSIGAPWATLSARAGNLYLPIPFAKSVKVVMTAKPFYFNIDYRAYPAGTKVQTYTPTDLKRYRVALSAAARSITTVPAMTGRWTSAVVQPGRAVEVPLPTGARAINRLGIHIEGAETHPERLRATVLSARFDGDETVWCPVGDFFGSADSLHPFHTLTRAVGPQGTMICRWTMPYRKSGHLRFINQGRQPETIRWRVETSPHRWSPRTMHFYARWRPDDIVPGVPFLDWNFIDIHGRGVYIGDAWTVLNPRPNSWWGEGDEKIYVDDDWNRGFPTDFGTGTEDYYGWAGGVYPVRDDEFSAPFLANIRVGGLDGHTQGYNICTRMRGLDAIPFTKALRFDMEASFGTDMRTPTDLLDYSAVTFWYARPGAQHNAPPNPASAAKPIVSLADLQSRAAHIRATQAKG